MDNHERRSIHAIHEQSLFGLEEADRCTLRQLDDTRYLAVGELDDARCQRLGRLGFALGDDDGFWKITPAGRRLIR
jgi:hypothetical protein